MRAICRTLVASLVLLAASTPPTLAQAPRIDGPQPSRLTFPVAAETTTLRAEMMRSVPPNHWKRGALIGGGVPAVLVLVAAMFDDCTGDNCHLAGLVYAPGVFLLGALPGSLIGSMFPRDTL